MKDKLKEFINENLIIVNKYCGNALFKSKKSNIYLEEDRCSSIEEYIDDNKNNNNFQKLLFKFIDDRGLKDSDVYNSVHIDRRLFSKIRVDENYHPSKDTVILLGLALKLNIDEFSLLLDNASYSLPKNNYFDLIIRFCFIEGIYSVYDVNELLSIYNCRLFSY